MSRRRLRLVCSSDEEDDGPPPPLPPPPPLHHHEEGIDDMESNFQTVTLNSANPTPSTDSTTANRTGMPSIEPIPLDISDGETISTGSDYSASGGNSSRYYEASESSVSRVVEGLGLRLRREWLDSCLDVLGSSVPGFQGMDDSGKAKLCFGQFLGSDMNCCGAGMLPTNVHGMHCVNLKGPLVLQVDEIVNISCALRGRYQSATAGVRRCLKLSMTDGVQRVFGMEYRPIKDLEVLAPAGLKVAVCNVNIRHGLLMLVPEVLEVLGGAVEELETARKRLVNEINKPPRGKRTRTGVVPPLASRATLAAWQANDDASPAIPTGNTAVNTTPGQASRQETGPSIPGNDMRRQAFVTPIRRNYAEPNTPAASCPQQLDQVRRHTGTPASTPSGVAGRGTASSIPAYDRPMEDVRIPASSIPANHRPMENFRVPVSRSYTEHNTSEMQPLERVTIPEHIDESSTEGTAPSRATRQVTPPDVPANCMSRENVNVPSSGDNPESNTSYATDMDVEEISMVDELELNFILSRDKETPFTYLSSLSTKCATIQDEAVHAVRGKIKCFITGVKAFQWRDRAEFDLRVYVDDGSLISEILIDHNLVQNKVGYSPQEVTNDSSSPHMKETMRQFQSFLVNFEGIMVVQMSKTSPITVAVEMNEGCSSSDACLLLNRLRPFSSTLPPNTSHSNFIELSP